MGFHLGATCNFHGIGTLFYLTVITGVVVYKMIKMIINNIVSVSLSVDQMLVHFLLKSCCFFVTLYKKL